MLTKILSLLSLSSLLISPASAAKYYTVDFTDASEFPSGVPSSHSLNLFVNDVVLFAFNENPSTGYVWT
jgi:hypothetical protein